MLCPITRSAILVAALFLALMPLTGSAQSYPTKPIRVIVAFPAGSGVDATTRFMTGKMAPLLGQSVVVENRPGASGMLGTEAAAKATPDGYSLFMAPYMDASRSASFPTAEKKGGVHVHLLPPSCCRVSIPRFPTTWPGISRR